MTNQNQADLRAEAENVVLALEKFGKKFASYLKYEQADAPSKNTSKCNDHLQDDEKNAHSSLSKDRILLGEAQDFLNKIRKRFDPSLHDLLPGHTPIFEVLGRWFGEKIRKFLLFQLKSGLIL